MNLAYREIECQKQARALESDQVWQSFRNQLEQRGIDVEKIKSVCEKERCMADIVRTIEDAAQPLCGY